MKMSKRERDLNEKIASLAAENAMKFYKLCGENDCEGHETLDLLTKSLASLALPVLGMIESNKPSKKTKEQLLQDLIEDITTHLKRILTIGLREHPEFFSESPSKKSCFCGKCPTHTGVTQAENDTVH